MTVRGVSNFVLRWISRHLLHKNSHVGLQFVLKTVTKKPRSTITLKARVSIWFLLQIKENAQSYSKFLEHRTSMLLIFDYHSFLNTNQYTLTNGFSPCQLSLKTTLVLQCMCTYIRLVLAAAFTAAKFLVVTRATVGTMTIISMTTGIVINPSVSRRTTRTYTSKINVFIMCHGGHIPAKMKFSVLLSMHCNFFPCVFYIKIKQLALPGL